MYSHLIEYDNYVEEEIKEYRQAPSLSAVLTHDGFRSLCLR